MHTLNLYDRLGKTVFRDEPNNRIIKSFRSENGDRLFIAELPIHTDDLSKMFQIEITREDAERFKKQVEAGIILPFNFKGISLKTKEQIYAMVNIYGYEASERQRVML